MMCREGVCRSDLHPEADRDKPWEKNCSVYVGFMDLEKVYDRVNRQALCQVLRMY